MIPLISPPINNVFELVTTTPKTKKTPTNMVDIATKFEHSVQKKTHNILLVDDDPLVEIVIRAMLAEHNFNIDFAPSAIEAMLMVSQGNYDIILMDIVMPEFTGTDAMLKLKKHINPASTKIIAHTANKDGVSDSEYLNLGFDSVLLKPVKQSVLVEMVKSLLT
ncbi:response regulator [Pseudoalteromonas sp. S558]|uniref:response regulator n=1 Tax=Pseudoalteromonas sp. S558 TaxID=2066515 RepID=UPI00207BB6CF|nr:response regulator [Pseudoalteromonas sp. S558]